MSQNSYSNKRNGSSQKQSYPTSSRASVLCMLMFEQTKAMILKTASSSRVVGCDLTDIMLCTSSIFRLGMSRQSIQVFNLIWEFPERRGTVIGGPYKNYGDPTI